MNLYFNPGSLYKIPPKIMETINDNCFKIEIPDIEILGSSSAINNNLSATIKIIDII